MGLGALGEDVDVQRAIGHEIGQLQSSRRAH
jgi:hypothetical protein